MPRTAVRDRLSELPPPQRVSGPRTFSDPETRNANCVAMSGRTRVTLADGRRVTGYRKTLARRAPRTPAHLREAWQLSLILPDDDMRFFGLANGQSDVMGVAIERIAATFKVVASGKNREWVVTQLVKWLRLRARDYPRPLNATLFRPGDQDGPTLSGPRHGPETVPCQIKLGYPAYIKFGSSMRSLTI